MTHPVWWRTLRRTELSEGHQTQKAKYRCFHFSDILENKGFLGWERAGLKTAQVTFEDDGPVLDCHGGYTMECFYQSS